MATLNDTIVNGNLIIQGELLLGASKNAIPIISIWRDHTGDPLYPADPPDSFPVLRIASVNDANGIRTLRIWTY